ncbi:TPA: ABC transporter permease [Burkholderia cenocepacia]|uniref:ABC transporter permease subunit n=1 Tax=Burkholderia latens TaxID=488446 RepID=A0A6H9STG2_9BURK|nr:MULTISPECIES: ABC transporter permease subunit [Burkholderia]KAB0644522.1 ABC transporter permease subunit [Burkholderia latens]UJH78763.1 ABC transporter permease subunit [Burkholderia cenocepacia]VWB24169.1 Polar amino acid ABC transporter inner membrane subunit [Burkholderia latens]HDR9879674.1 ABC transporter permease subunit [Burkholderia cenocepacia]HDR9886763.1 ABC transporter permease subunit [Burkholderia cenocepacia]
MDELIAMSLPLLFQGAKVTLMIGLAGVVAGFPLGVLLALLRIGPRRMLAALGDAYSAFFRGTPMLVQIFIIYYGFGQVQFVQDTTVLWWLFGDSLHCAMMTVLLNTVAYTSEIFRGAFLAVPKGAMEAALASGMSPGTVLRRIMYPLALRQALPAYGNEVAIVIKESSLASTITVLEITGQAKRLMSETFAIIEIFAIASALYLLINFFALLAVRLVERQLSNSDATAHRPAII